MKAEGEFFAAVGVGCALLQLPDAAGTLTASSQSPQANASATVTFSERSAPADPGRTLAIDAPTDSPRAR